jgi:hypothetical protein
MVKISPLPFTVGQTAEEASADINNVRGWWSRQKLKVTPTKSAMGLTYRYKDVHYSKQKKTELIPGRKVVCLVLNSYLKFTKDTTE